MQKHKDNDCQPTGSEWEYLWIILKIIKVQSSKLLSLSLAVILDLNLSLMNQEDKLVPWLFIDVTDVALVDVDLYVLMLGCVAWC